MASPMRSRPASEEERCRPVFFTDSLLLSVALVSGLPVAGREGGVSSLGAAGRVWGTGRLGALEMRKRRGDVEEEDGTWHCPEARIPPPSQPPAPRGIPQPAHG